MQKATMLASSDESNVTRNLLRPPPCHLQNQTLLCSRNDGDASASASLVLCCHLEDVQQACLGWIGSARGKAEFAGRIGGLAEEVHPPM